LRTILIKATGQTALNFPEIDITQHSKEIIVFVKFVDINSPFTYFIPKKDHSKLPFKSKADLSIDVESATECAIEALRSKTAVGFQYCNMKGEKFCDLISDSKLAVSKKIKNTVQLKRNEKIYREILSI